jgi:hypothetical protein
MQLVKACVWLRKFRRNSDGMLDLRFHKCGYEVLYLLGYNAV